MRFARLTLSHMFSDLQYELKHILDVTKCELVHLSEEAFANEYIMHICICILFKLVNKLPQSLN